jgi:hypothetical protein
MKPKQVKAAKLSPPPKPLSKLKKSHSNRPNSNKKLVNRLMLEESK